MNKNFKALARDGSAWNLVAEVEYVESHFEDITKVKTPTWITVQTDGGCPVQAVGRGVFEILSPLDEIVIVQCDELQQFADSLLQGRPRMQ